MRRVFPIVLTAGVIYVSLLYISGGGVIEVGGIRVSSRNPMRPALALAAAAAMWLAARRGRALEDLRESIAGIARHGMAAACVVAAIAAGVSWVYGTHAASGADSYGYVSQSRLWLDRDLMQPVPLRGQASWPHLTNSMAPLGYTTSQDGGALVPTYSAGLPIVMAALRMPFGECGPFVAGPLFAAGALLAAFLLARRFGGRGNAVATAALLAASPVFLHAAIWPMSDVPVTALWTGAMALALGGGTRSATFAGALAGAAIAVRPNLLLVLAAFILGLAALERGWRLVTPLPRRAIAAAMTSAPFVIAAAAIQARLYGAPWRSGYGPFDYLYQLENIAPNAARYGRHLLEAQTPFVLLALIPLVAAAAGWRSALRRHVLFVALIVAAWTASYLPYAQFDEWWYLRFFLGLFPLLIVLSLDGLRALLARAGRAALPLAWLILVTLVIWSLHAAVSRGVFFQRELEQRYVAVARYVDRTLPSNAAILAMQHSGSVRYYAGRLTVRYDRIGHNGLTRVLAELQRLGYRPYILIDDWEADAFRSRFAGSGEPGRLAIPKIARMTHPAPVSLYDPLGTDPEASLILPEPIPRLEETCPAPAASKNW